VLIVDYQIAFPLVDRLFGWNFRAISLIFVTVKVLELIFINTS
jgi:hypothetical protein